MENLLSCILYILYYILYTLYTILYSDGGLLTEDLSEAFYLKKRFSMHGSDMPSKNIFKSYTIRTVLILQKNIFNILSDTLYFYYWNSEIDHLRVILTNPRSFDISKCPSNPFLNPYYTRLFLQKFPQSTAFVVILLTFCAVRAINSCFNWATLWRSKRKPADDRCWTAWEFWNTI